MIYGEQQVTMKLPNPRVHQASLAVLWSWEVKAAFGILGTLADMWVTPVGLQLAQLPRGRNSKNTKIPRDMQSMKFEASAKHGGHTVVPAANIMPGAVYKVRAHGYVGTLMQ